MRILNASGSCSATPMHQQADSARPFPAVASLLAGRPAPLIVERFRSPISARARTGSTTMEKIQTLSEYAFAGYFPGQERFSLSGPTWPVRLRAGTKPFDNQ